MHGDVTPDKLAKGHAAYTRAFLAVYDLFVLSFLSRFAWKCPASRILDLYNEHVSGNHLDVGVGTGYFLNECRFPVPIPRIGLMDLSPNCLEVAERRLIRYKPEVYRVNVLEPIHIDAPKFDSVGMNYLLHCLPGTIRSKAVVFEHLKPWVNPGGVVFGATMLYDGVDKNWLARKLMNRLNADGVFTNTADDLNGLHWVLSRHLSDPVVKIVGTAALFWGRT